MKSQGLHAGTGCNVTTTTDCNLVTQLALKESFDIFGNVLFFGTQLDEKINTSVVFVC